MPGDPITVVPCTITTATIGNVTITAADAVVVAVPDITNPPTVTYTYLNMFNAVVKSIKFRLTYNQTTDICGTSIDYRIDTGIAGGIQIDSRSETGSTYTVNFPYGTGMTIEIEQTNVYYTHSLPSNRSLGPLQAFFYLYAHPTGVGGMASKVETNTYYQMNNQYFHTITPSATDLRLPAQDPGVSPLQVALVPMTSTGDQFKFYFSSKFQNVTGGSLGLDSLTLQYDLNGTPTSASFTLTPGALTIPGSSITTDSQFYSTNTITAPSANWTIDTVTLDATWS